MIQTMRRLGMPSVRFLALLLVFGAIERQAESQCTANAPIRQFHPSGNPLGYGPAGHFKSGFATNIEMYGPSTARKLILHENFGYTIYDLSSPGAPVSSGAKDIESVQGSFAKVGDGFSTITTATASADGSRALVATRTTPHGSLLMKANGSAFDFAGEFNPASAGSLVIDQIGSRYLGYALFGFGASTPLRVADISNFVTSAPANVTAGSISGETVPGARGGNGMLRAGHYLVYSTGDAIVIVNAANPGPAGNIASGLTIQEFPVSAFGLPGGNYVGDFAAAIHPSDNKLYIMLHSRLTTANVSSGVALARYDGANLSIVGAKLALPGQWSGATPSASGAIIPTSDDLLVMTWAYTNAAQGSQNKLFTWSASAWGTDMTPAVTANSWDFMGASSSLLPNPVAMRGFAQGNQIYTYFGTGEAAFGMSLTCSVSAGPATADMTVQTDPAGTNIPDGGNVFVGDKLKITPSVSPSQTSQPLTDWRFDYNFHAGTSEDNGAGTRIKFPDVQGAPPPSTLSLVGPCDPSVSGTTASTGAGCWASVTGNGDFPSSPAAGTTKTLVLAVQATNALGSSGLKTFRLNFVVPRVKLRSTSFLSSTSTPVIDGSEGTPSASGYKWYFGGSTLAPAGETLTQDTSCTGAICNHSFGGKGNYNYFLSVPYANGYASPDCANPCTQALGSVAITDVVLAFTAPASVQKTSSTFSVTSQSQQGSVTPCSNAGSNPGLEYNICDATLAACSAGSYSPLTLSSFSGGSASILTPQTSGTYYLRIRYNYQTTSSPCSSVSWSPNTVASDPTAWSFVVSNVTPTVRVSIAGAAPVVCGAGAGGGGSACQVTVGDALVAYAYANGVPENAGNQTWSGPGAIPSTGSGATYAFQYTSQGTKNITLVADGQTVIQPIDVSPVPPVITPLSISFASASPSNPTPGQSVTFQAGATGGSGSVSGYTWAFGDGGSGTGSNVSHSYASAGTYSASVTARTTNGDTASRGVSVSVSTGAPPQVYIDFAIKDDATGLLCQYSSAFGYGANSGQVLRMVPTNVTGAVTWTFSDGTSSTEVSPAKTFQTATDKVYTVKLVANGQTKQYTIEIAGGAGPQLTGAYTYRYADGTSVATSTVTAGKSIKFTASDAADTYLWDFNDGSALASSSPIEHTFSFSGTFKVTLSVTKAGLSPATTASPTPFTIPAPPEPDQWLVPGMAYTDGLGGASWQSDLSVYNPHTTQPMTISLAFLDGQVAITNPNSLQWTQYVLRQGQTITFVNALKNAPFYLPKGKYGAILIRGDVLPSQPVFSSRTYNTGTGSGTYGLSMAATAVSGGVHVGPQAPAAVAASRLIGLREDSNSYTNFGMANLKSDYANVEVKFYDKVGTQLGQPVTFQLAPYGVAQYNHVLSADPPLGAGYTTPVNTFSAAVRIVSGTAVSPYATVIDNVSKDPIFITPPTHPSASYRLPGIIRAQGKNNTIWRSDLVLYNPSASTRKVTLTYSFLSDSGLQARSSVSKFIDLLPNQIAAADDFVKVWLNLSDDDKTNFSNSWVDVAPAAGDSDTDPLLIMGHTYNNQPSGNVGLQVPGFTVDDGVTSATAKKRLLMTGLTSSSAYRTNAAFFCVSQTIPCSVQANVKLLDSTGTLIKTVGISLDAFNGFTQKNDNELFGDLGGDKSNMSIVLDNVVGSSPIAGYATVIDQVSGDAILIQAQPAP